MNVFGRRSVGIVLVLLASGRVAAQPDPTTDEAEKKGLSQETFAGLKLRGVGPALMSGRVGDFAVNPGDRANYYVAVCSGGVWKTVNAGVTWTPIFDGQGSYSIGCLALDPHNGNVLWVGTGENNSQRSVGYGDGVYKSIDGGKSWQHMGLKDSEHIGQIVVDPRDSDVVYVAAQGPLWRAGGDRGLYKTTDGGVTWQQVLSISDDTGVSEVLLDPRDPDVVYAVAYQRRRRQWTLINGGPESGIHKSTDGGATWVELEQGLPKGDMGRIGMAMAASNPDVLYAVVEAANDEGGFFRSTDRGASWQQRSDYVSGSPQYYQELFVDPHDADRIYSMDTWLNLSTDGGETFNNIEGYFKHVDNHAMWIDPRDTSYLLVGCDGGIYESFDRGETWKFIPNLPVTQFYKVAVDNDTPFYNVYGGTQDNFSIGGPSRTVNQHGITNREWFFTLGGDGFETAIDPENPDIIYSQSQHGNLNRFDRKNGEIIDIQPQAAPGEDPLRWNWDAPLMISPHSPTRLYFAAQRLFRSDDRGNSWSTVSGDLSRQIDRNELEIMGKVWSVDAVAKNRSTSFYGSVVSLTESPRVEGLLYAGSDDGLVQVLEPGSDSWRKIERFPGVPEFTYVDHLEASWHDDDTVYAAFNNHKSGDFAPFILKSQDRGRSWTAIQGDLPQRGSVYSLAEDHENADLLFAGTEFGAFFTVDGGEHWLPLEGGLPTVAIRDIAIQRREDDLVLASFGRGFFILDDYSPLRTMSQAVSQEATLFPVKEAWMYMQAFPLGLRGNAHQGEGFYAAPNPPFGATFTYYLKDAIESRKERRQGTEKKIEGEDGSLRYPSWEALRQEDLEEAPAVVLTVSDSQGNVVRRLQGPLSAGSHRVTWDLRYPSPDPVSLEPFDWHNPFQDPPRGPMAVPGTYQVALAKRVDGELVPLAEPQSFEATPLGIATLAADDRQELLAFQRKTARLQRAVLASSSALAEAQGRLEQILVALDDTPGDIDELAQEARHIGGRLSDLETQLHGDATVASRSEPTAASISELVGRVVSGHWTSTSAPTQTHRDNYTYAAEAFEPWLASFQRVLGKDLAALEGAMETVSAPWTPGRVPSWQKE